jgi:hypothetical protein
VIGNVEQNPLFERFSQLAGAILLRRATCPEPIKPGNFAKPGAIFQLLEVCMPRGVIYLLIQHGDSLWRQHIPRLKVILPL